MSYNRNIIWWQRRKNGIFTLSNSISLYFSFTVPNAERQEARLSPVLVHVRECLLFKARGAGEKSSSSVSFNYPLKNKLSFLMTFLDSINLSFSQKKRIFQVKSAEQIFISVWSVIFFSLVCFRSDCFRAGEILEEKYFPLLAFS